MTLVLLGEGEKVKALFEGETSKDEFASCRGQHSEESFKGEFGNVEVEGSFTANRGLHIDVLLV